MGQTLTHGIYLPDEGERNCYSGLAGNWQLLDGAVGTVAEHTTALAGKAPAVHTHTKSDITDFPAYGNTAGTICEGNDSRLSDARTPLSHTHTKSDVTGLLNSNFIPSANNSYDLGSSSYQWNNLYAKKYYYNGVAWGLDKANTWSNDQIIASGSNDKCYYVKDTVYELGQTYSNGEHLGGLTIQDKNGATVGLLDIADRSYGNTEMRIRVQQKFDPDSNNRSTSGTTVNNELIIGIGPSKETYVTLNGSLRAGTNNAYALGTSSKKWKTLNGVNPGALSLPDMSSGTGVSLSAGSNSYSPPSSGWLSINLTGAISVVCGNFCHSGTDMLSVPVVKGSTYTVTVATSGTAYLFVSQGNV